MRTWRSENFFSSSRVRLGGVLETEFAVGKEGGVQGQRGVPLLDFVKALEEGDGDEDDDGFLAVTDFDLGVGGVSERSMYGRAQLGRSGNQVVPSPLDCVEFDSPRCLKMTWDSIPHERK